MKKFKAGKTVKVKWPIDVSKGTIESVVDVTDKNGKETFYYVKFLGLEDEIMFSESDLEEVK